jgi:hypothetical protein
MPTCVGVSPQKVGDLGVAEQHFGGDASNVQTEPAPVKGFPDATDNPSCATDRGT